MNQNAIKLVTKERRRKRNRHVARVAFAPLPLSCVASAAAAGRAVVRGAMVGRAVLVFVVVLIDQRERRAKGRDGLVTALLEQRPGSVAPPLSSP